MGLPNIKMPLMGFLFFAFLAAVVELPLYGEVTVAVFQGAEPVLIINEDGSATGFYPEMLKAIFEGEEEVRFITGLTFQEAYDKVKNNEIDLLPAAIRSPERERELLFNDQVFVVSWGEVFVAGDTYVDSVFDLNNWEIGLMEGDQNGINFIRYMDSFDIPFVPVYYPSLADMAEDVADHKVDAMVCFSSFNSGGLLKSVGIVFSPSQAYVAMGKGGRQEILELIDRKLSDMKGKEDSPLDRELKRWFHYGMVEKTPDWVWPVVYATLLGLMFFAMLALFLKLKMERSRRATLEREKEFDRAIANAELNYRTIADYNYDWEFWMTAKGDFLYCSPSCYDLTGYGAEDFIKKRVLMTEIIHPEDREKWIEHNRDTGDEQFRDIYRVIHRNGEIKWFAHQCRHIFHGGGRFAGHRGSFKDITEQKAYEKALVDSERRYRAIVENTRDIVWLIDKDGRLSYINKSLKELFNLDREIDPGTNVEEFLRNSGNSNGADQIRKCFLGNRPEHFNLYMNREGGSHGGFFPTLATPLRSGDEVSVLLFSRDVSEVQKLEMQVQRSQKLESVGTVAGGIAHDFNNLLAPIMGYGDLIRDTLDGDDPAQEYVSEILRAGEKGRDLISQLLTFSKSKEIKYEAIGLNHILGQFENLLRSCLSRSVLLSLALSDGELTVFGDRGQIEQVVMNLVVNARDAIGPSGKIDVNTERISLAKEVIVDEILLPPGKYALLSVSDDGKGMDALTLTKLFDPFYSTKGDKGTGLGLSTAYGIIKQHKGSVAVRSELGGGTEFSLYFPLLAEGDREA